MLPVISPAETLQKLRDGKIRLVDIREPDEVNAVRVPGAEVAPLSVIKWSHLALSDADQPIVFTCNSGNRTSKQSDLLEELAGGPAWQMEGGVSAWAKEG
ncbi:rhodanese, partial [Muribaculaceae bacterium Isolate-002 (NCI)]